MGASLGARLELRDISRGQHGSHTRQRARLRDVDPFDPRVGVWTAQQARLQQPRQLYVADVLRATSDLLGRIEARNRDTDAAAADFARGGHDCRHELSLPAASEIAATILV